MFSVVVFGGSGGIGRAIIRGLAAKRPDAVIHATYLNSSPEDSGLTCQWHQLDIRDEAAVSEYCKSLPKIDLCLFASGLLHKEGCMPEKSLHAVDPEFMLENFAVNAASALLVAKHVERRLRASDGASFVAVSARVGSISDNRLGGWYSYRMSKAALNMAVRTLAIEWRRKFPSLCVVALHPGTVDTALSAPFQKRLPEGQVQTPDQCALAMLNVILSLRPEDSGKFWSFEGQEIPW